MSPQPKYFEILSFKRGLVILCEQDIAVNVPAIGENSVESPGNGSTISCKSIDFSINEISGLS